MKKIIPYIKSALPDAGCQLFIEFEDGVTGLIDLSKWKVKGLFKYWDNEDNFRNFKINTSKKIEWNEDIEMDPDAFYLKLTGKNFQEYADNKQLLRHTY